MNIKTDLTSVNYRSGRNGNSIDYIVCHFTGNQNDKASGNANYFRCVNRQASAHYFVDDNEIVQVVREGDTSWHCGDGNGRYGITNSNSIGIEMCATNGDISEKTIENTLWLVKSLMNKYGIDIDHVVRHYDASRKCCPSPFSPNNWSRWWEFKERLKGTVENIEVTTQSTNGFYESDIKKTNATIVGLGDIEVLNDKCEVIRDRYISSLDRIYVLGIYPSRNFIEVIYPGKDKNYHAYIDIKYYSRISFDFHMQYKNDDGDTYVWWSSKDVNKTEPNEILSPNKKASPMYRENGWLRITFYRENGVATDGFVRYEGEQAVKFYEEEKIKDGIVKVNTYLNVRDSINGNIIGKVFNGEEVSIIWTKDGWYYIEYNTNHGKKRGYVSSKYVEEV
ncbi:N-acetylmuramoyl-L-alanine amidase [Clostridium perfringens]|nr:N-acetylmuramoyl-L-alanine amidase [Clostridium perfringens]